MRRVILIALFVQCSFLALTSHAQTGPQPVRDYVYGPGGKLIVTIEPDTYPPDGPYSISASMTGDCAIDGVDVSWDTASDVGSGVGGYSMDNHWTSDTSYHDSNVQGGRWYTYTVYAVDNAGNRGQSVSTSVHVDLCFSYLIRKQPFSWARFSPQLPRLGAPRRFVPAVSTNLSPQALLLRRLTLNLLRSSSLFPTAVRSVGKLEQNSLADFAQPSFSLRPRATLLTGGEL